MQVAHGLLSGVERYAGESAVVRLFGQVLAGKADDATWRYTMHWRRVAAAAALDSGDGFRDWLAELYPGMKDDEVSRRARGASLRAGVTHQQEPGAGADPSTPLCFAVKGGMP